MGMKESFFTSHDAKELERISKEAEERLNRDVVIVWVSIFIAPLVLIALKGVYSLLR
jgi:hypothetical protein